MSYIDGLLGDREVRVLTTRQHWITVIDAVVVNGLAILLLLAIGSWATARHLQGHLPAALPLLVAAALALYPGARMIAELLHWWNDLYIVTNRRIIQASGIVNKHTIDSSLEKINDVVLTQTILGRLFDYGNLEILTASEIGVNKLERIARPIRFKTEMLNQREALRDADDLPRRPSRPPDGGDEPVRQDIPDMIAELDELRRRGVITDTEFQHKKAELLSRL